MIKLRAKRAKSQLLVAYQILPYTDLITGLSYVGPTNYNPNPLLLAFRKDFHQAVPRRDWTACDPMRSYAPRRDSKMILRVPKWVVNKASIFFGVKVEKNDAKIDILGNFS